MHYCSNCGSPVEGQFCAKCGAAATPGASSPGTGPYVPPSSSPGLGIDNNLAGALCYIPIVGLIFLLLDPYRRDRTIRFHAWQSLLLLCALIVVRIGLAIIWGILESIMPWTLWNLMFSLVELAYVVGLVLMAVKAYQGGKLVLPIIGPIATKQAG